MLDNEFWLNIIGIIIVFFILCLLYMILSPTWLMIIFCYIPAIWLVFIIAIIGILTNDD